MRRPPGYLSAYTDQRHLDYLDWMIREGMATSRSQAIKTIMDWVMAEMPCTQKQETAQKMERIETAQKTERTDIGETAQKPLFTIK